MLNFTNAIVWKVTFAMTTRTSHITSRHVSIPSNKKIILQCKAIGFGSGLFILNLTLESLLEPFKGENFSPNPKSPPHLCIQVIGYRIFWWRSSKISPTYPWKIPLTRHKQFLEKFVSFWRFGKSGVSSHVGKIIEKCMTSGNSQKMQIRLPGSRKQRLKFGKTSVLFLFFNFWLGWMIDLSVCFRITHISCL